MNQFANTETPCPDKSPAAVQGVGSPEGPGRDGHKPLMRNRRATDGPSPIGIAPGDTFRLAPSTQRRRIRNRRIYDAYLRWAEVNQDLTFREFLTSSRYEETRWNCGL